MTAKTVFWDWNGTLLNDTDACVEAMNVMLAKRAMQLINKKIYRSLFGFPVIDYYKKIGFDLSNEQFEKLSVEFISEYNRRLDKVELFESAIEVLDYFKAAGIRQVIISAMEQNMLVKLLKDHKIDHYFYEIKGLENIYAKGKTHLAQEYLIENNARPSEILYIGDTIHDAEVADAIGSQLILVSAGHYVHNRLAINGYKVISDLSELIN